MNKLIKYNEESTNWTLHLFTFNKWGWGEMDEQEETFTGTFDKAREWAVERWDNYDAMAEVEKYYGGSGFSLDDERGKTWMTEEDV